MKHTKIPMKEIDQGTLLFDCRKLKGSLQAISERVRKAACKHIYGNEYGLVRDYSEHGSGTYFGGNFINVYHIASVAKNIWIVASREMTPEETRPIAKLYLKQK